MTLDTFEEFLAPTSPPFLAGYAALEAEIGNYEHALMLARDFEAMVSHGNVTQVALMCADIFFEMGQLRTAFDFVHEAVQLDSNHLLAIRKKTLFRRHYYKIKAKKSTLLLRVLRIAFGILDCSETDETATDVGLYRLGAIGAFAGMINRSIAVMGCTSRLRRRG